MAQGSTRARPPSTRRLLCKVAVVGGGPSGSCAAETLAKAGIKTWMSEPSLGVYRYAAPWLTGNTGKLCTGRRDFTSTDIYMYR